MKSNSRLPSSYRTLGLAVGVQFDAFRSDPAKYLQGVFWRLRGLKVRSHNRFAALAGRSDWAYSLWIAREEPKLFPSTDRAVAGSVTIIAVIDCQRDAHGVEATVASVREAGFQGPIVAVGNCGIPGVLLLKAPGEIAWMITSDAVWLCPLSAGDRLALHALSEYVAAAESAHDAEVIYADDDLIGADGERTEPHFKPDWNPELFEHHDFITGAAIVRAKPGYLKDLSTGNWAQELVAAALKRGGPPEHVPLVLHHRKCRPAPVLPTQSSQVLPDPLPSVTVIVPTRNQYELLRKCIEGVASTKYPILDLIIVDNGSDDSVTRDYLRQLEANGAVVLRIPGPFNFSRLNNEAVKHAAGEVLCFLNNDVEMLDDDWLIALVRQAARQDIGAVGARLLYEDMTVQHAGVVLGIGGGAGHGHRFVRQDETGYFDRARLPQRVSAVTAACLVVQKAKFLSVGGFDEQDFPVAFNDVDLCLKLNERGWQSFYEPRATLIHHESKSRGSDASKVNRDRFAGELIALKRKWHTDQMRDPYHHPSLSRFCEQFLIAI